MSFSSLKKRWDLFEKVRDDTGRDLNLSDITPTDLQDESVGPIVIEKYREDVSKRIKSDKFMKTLSVYNSFILHHFDSFLRTEVDLVEDDIRLVLDEKISSFTAYEITPGIFNFKDLTEVLTKIPQLGFDGLNTSNIIEFNHISMKTKLIVGRRT